MYLQRDNYSNTVKKKILHLLHNLSFHYFTQAVMNYSYSDEFIYFLIFSSY